MSSAENFLENRFRASLKMDNLAAAIVRRFPAMDPAVALQPVEQTGQRRLLDPHPLRDLLLRELISAAGEIRQGAPFTLTQPERAQTPIESVPPGAGRAEKHDSEFVNRGGRHGGN